PPLVSFTVSLPRLPPGPTLFPSTTLFRSRPPSRAGRRCRTPRFDPLFWHWILGWSCSPTWGRWPIGIISNWCGDTEQNAPTRRRSEEHTSELQSRFDLVCRLLLEHRKRSL